MFKSSFAVMAAAASVVFAVACEQAATSPPETTELGTPAPSFARHGVTQRRVTMMDACDPITFNAAFGPGTCVRNGGVTVDRFVAQLVKHQKAGGWFFAPKQMSAKVGDALLAVNRGGEFHTFTEVAQFGGGFIDDLNQLAGTPIPAPECLTLGGGDFVPPDGTFPESVSGPPGERFFMCCIHPWMRTTVVAR